MRTRSGPGALCDGSTAAESTILACLRGEGREPRRGRRGVLSRDEEARVRRCFFVDSLRGNVGNAREEEGEEQRNKEKDTKSREREMDKVDGGEGACEAYPCLATYPRRVATRAIRAKMETYA